MAYFVMFSPVTSRRDNFGQSNYKSLLFRPWKEFEKMGIKQYDYDLSKEPHNSLSTYLRAAALKNSSCFKDALKDYEGFLSIGPSDASK